MIHVSAPSKPDTQLLRFRDIALPRFKGNGKRIAVVISKTDYEDIESGGLLAHGNLPHKIYDVVFRSAGYPLEELDILAIPCDAFEINQGRKGKPTGLRDIEVQTEEADKELLDMLHKHNLNYVTSRIEKFQPEMVMCFGAEATAYLSQFRTDQILATQLPQFVVGVPQSAKINDFEFMLMASPCPVEISTSRKGAERSINLMGQVTRYIETLMHGDVLYPIRRNYRDTAKIHVIDTIAKFDKFMDLLYEKPVWAIDTEARNLFRVANSLQIIQFADSEDRAFVLPVKHRDAPWVAGELEYILLELGDYFYDNDADYHVYHNAAFDLPLLKSELGISHYCADVWDTMAGEFAFDENLDGMNDFYKKVNKLAAGDYSDDEDEEDASSSKRIGHHSLLSMCIQHGNLEYLSGQFGKESRADIHSLPLSTPDLIFYCFDPSTEVLCEKGVFNIVDIINGADTGRAYSYNHKTGDVELQPITHRYTNPVTEDVYEIEHEHGTLRVTASHEIWSVTRNAYVRADSLQPGEEVLAVDRRNTTLQSVKSVGRPDHVYDVTVADNHNLFVRTTGDFVLAHNCAQDVLTIFGIMRQQIARAKDYQIKNYEKVVRKLISDQINTFGTMQLNGELVDLDYLWRINAPNSHINELIESLRAELLARPEVIEAEKRVMESTGRSRTRKLFDFVKERLFDFNKYDHLFALFNDVMGLEAPQSETGQASYGKAFKSQYGKDNKVVSMFNDLGKAEKLRQAFLTPLLKIATTNPDTLTDNRIRAAYHFVRIVTGRVASTNPNLQQVPSHGPLAKAVKRIFIADRGSLFLKVDFSAHELRLWAVISGCKDLAGAFQKGLDWIAKFRKDPRPEYVEKHGLEGDIHRVNSVTFGMAASPADVTDDIRSAVKGIAFGSVYGRTLKSLASALGMALETVEKVFAAFFAKLPVASNWLLNIEKEAQRNFFVKSNLHRRRNLSGLLLYRWFKDDRRLKSIMNALGRRARNSPIQGMGSDLGFSGARLIEKIVWAMTKHSERWRKTLPLRNCNMVHDSSEMEAVYSFILPSIEVIEYGLTLGNQQKVGEIYGMTFPVDLAIEMEIGPNLAMMEKWAIGFRDKLDDQGNPVYKLDANGQKIPKLDKKTKQPATDKKGNPVYQVEQIVAGDFDHLYDILKWALETQNSEHHYDVDVESTLAKIFVPKHTPKFLLDLAKQGKFKHAKKYGYDKYDDSNHLTLAEKVDQGLLDFYY